jgi:hypothetical protein
MSVIIKITTMTSTEIEITAYTMFKISRTSTTIIFTKHNMPTRSTNSTITNI